MGSSGSTLSEPSCRFAHYSAAVGGQLYVFGGRTSKEWSEEEGDCSSESTGNVDCFNQSKESWVTRPTTGQCHPGLYRGACTSSGRNIYLYGGTNGYQYQNSLYKLDPDSLEWSELPSGPTRKVGCGMVSYQDKLILFGGYGQPSGPIQPGAEFACGRFNDNSGPGWTNELHCFDLQKGS